MRIENCSEISAYDENEYKQTDSSLRSRAKREPLYKALYGLGCLTSSWVIRSGQMVGGKMGILKVKSEEFSKRHRVVEK